MPDEHELIELRLVENISDLSATEWDQHLNGKDTPPGSPFLSYAFLNALESSKSATRETGWLPRHLVMQDDKGTFLAASPLYLKSHSQGEYVFDHNWAHAYEQSGGQYYPKLQCAVPFSPVTGPRLLVPADAIDRDSRLHVLAKGLIEVTQKLGVSSLHITFCTEGDAALLESYGFLIRHDHQYHWENNDYTSFDDFLTELSSRKRKNIRKERQALQDQGITTHALTGEDISPEHWDAFYRFYVDTYDRKWGYPYLTREFFDQLSASMADKTVLILSYLDGRPIAGAINFCDNNALYGRNWGCVEDHKFLHFETCYYAAMDFAIEYGLKRVEAGTGGHHKLQRGYVPHRTYSAHWMKNKNFRDAVARFLEQERNYAAKEADTLQQFTPFRKVQGEHL
ncbi:MAG: GNAT family N-acetyltransferase [Rhodospirillaceae bacterium]|nr:GNAT family N-acetyltransferase [Rhodospirillaceae bacterium]